MQNSFLYSQSFLMNQEFFKTQSIILLEEHKHLIKEVC